MSMIAQLPLFEDADARALKSAVRIRDDVGGVFDAAKLAQCFDMLAAAEGGIKRLRELVLSLAVRGCLAQQLAADGTADDMIVGLAAQRSKLASIAQVRTEQTAVPADEQPFSVPSSWRWVRLGHLGGFLGGGTPSKSNASFWKGPIPWVSPKDMKKPYIGDAEDHISDAAVEGSAVKLIPERSILFVVRGMILAHSFPVAMTTKAVTTNQDMKALVLAVPETSEYLLRACWAARSRVLRHVERSSHGTCRLKSEIVENLPIPLPPLAEQKRIVAKVDELMRMLDDLEAKQTKKREIRGRLRSAAVGALTSAEGPEEFNGAWKRVAENFDVLFDTSKSITDLRALLIDMAVTGRLIAPDATSITKVGNELANRANVDKRIAARIHELPSSCEARGWLHVPLGHTLSEPLANGRSVPDDPSGFPVLRLSALRGQFVDFSQRKLGAWTPDVAKPYVVQKGDVLIVRGNGALRLVGRACISAAPPTPVAFPDTAIRARLRKTLMTPEWLWYVWESRLVRQQVETAAKTTAGIFKVSQDDLYNVQVPVPTLDEQKRLVAKVDELMKLCDDLEAMLNRSEATASKLAEGVVAEMVA
jgi:type I restriction enzyme S subunit